MKAGALASAQEVVITAERLSVKSGLLLRGRGNIEAVIRESRLEADEIDVFLKIGDGEVRGEYPFNGEAPERPRARRGFRPSRFRFPPEIWKYANPLRSAVWGSIRDAFRAGARHASTAAAEQDRRTPLANVGTSVGCT